LSRFFCSTLPHPSALYPLSLHDALPICARCERRLEQVRGVHRAARGRARADHRVDLVDEHNRAGIGLELLDHLLEPFLEIAAIADRKSTRLNSSHDQISYAVFCLKKKKK